MTLLLISCCLLLLQLLGSLGLGRLHRPCSLAACQPSAHTVLAARQLRFRLDSTALVASLIVSLQPLNLPLLGSLGLGSPHGPMALLHVSFPILWLQLLGSLGLGRLHGPCGCAACQPTDFTPPDARQPWLRPSLMAIVVSLLVSLRPLRP